MPYIVTNVHDPVALAATCRRLGLHPPEQGCLHLDNIEAVGHIVRLPGLNARIVVNTLTGLVGYHPRDNAFVPFGQISRFIVRYYDIAAALRRGDRVDRRPHDRHPQRRRRRWVAEGAVA